MQQSPSREASPSTPPDFQLLQNFGSFHSKYAQSQLVGPSTSTTPVDTFTVQTTPLHPPPPLTNPPWVPLPPIMAAWFSPLALPQPLIPMPQYYQSKIPHFIRADSTTAQQHVDKMNHAFDYQEI